jgi:uncharacterized protein (DUF58 family)
VRRATLVGGLGFALCVTAASFAAAPLYVPGVALLLIAAFAVVWVRLAARHVSLQRSLGRTALEEQAALPVTVHLLRSRMPLPGAELRAWPGAPARALPRSRDATVTATARFARRGRRPLGPASLLVSDPLGLCGRRVFSTPDDVLVLPRVEPVRLFDVVGETDVLGRTGRGSAELAATDVDSVRPHRPETPASRIHWPTVARTMTLMERRLVADADQRPLVVVDPSHAASSDALDEAVRAGASLCVHLARQGGCALLLPGDRRPTPLGPELHGWPELHARLALLRPQAGAPAVAALAPADAVFWVTAATDPPAGVRHARARVRYLVSPGPAARWPIEFAVAGCSGQRLDLPVARTRVA